MSVILSCLVRCSILGFLPAWAGPAFDQLECLGLDQLEWLGLGQLLTSSWVCLNESM
jgi:hypothetical protein